jgi:pyruvate,orthophosphate dikinase
MTDTKYVYFFGDGDAEGKAEMKNLLGGKGANLAEMSNLGVPVPPGFTLTTEACIYYYKNDGEYPDGIEEEVNKDIKKVEDIMGKKFGDEEDPLLFSVRSGARMSMPGMMDTVLNLGLNDETVKGLATQADERFAWDSYRRFVQMFGDVVMDVKPESVDEGDPFEEEMEKLKAEEGVDNDVDLTVDALKELVKRFKQVIKDKTGQDFPNDPHDQLWMSIGAVFGSWNNDRAIAYREMNNIPDDWGTAVNVQTMVFGNMGEGSATGVAFTRNPATGENKFFGEYLPNAQGEDVVAGIRTPHPINKEDETPESPPSLETEMPEQYSELMDIQKKLEEHYKNMQDVEFTIQQGKLWMLQTRNGKRTAIAAIRMAAEMTEEGLIDKETAILRVEDPEYLNQLLRPVFDPKQKDKALDEGNLLATGLPAGPGAASGRVVFNAPDAVEWKKKGETVILVRLETSPEDIRGMDAAEGILTARGGMTSHAALVARQMGKTCIVGCDALQINYKERQMEVDGKTVKEGDWISIEGTSGEVISGKLETQPSEVVQVLIDETLKPEESKDFHIFNEFMKWADDVRKLGVRTNADQPDQAKGAIALGAEGIGLTRTEHMFFGGKRINAVREMILADDKEGREKALAKLLPMQRDDFKGIFEAMESRPVTIRALDPPLHEFLPHTDEEVKELADEIGVSEEKIRANMEALHEMNPMLGHRGCRLGITYPEITRMQVRAIMEAACEVKKEGGDPHPEIMIPLIGTKRELELQEKEAREVAEAVLEETGVDLDYQVGTMIEIPRAALTADEVAEVAEFFSFGTNDLTQTTLGISRDDAGRFLPEYVEQKVYKKDPFASLDQDGVGKLVKMGVELGRQTRKDLKVGICGEHGGDPSTVEFCHNVGLDYVSCSPFRVPIARLAAAQAVLKEQGKTA